MAITHWAKASGGGAYCGEVNHFHPHRLATKKDEVTCYWCLRSAEMLTEQLMPDRTGGQPLAGWEEDSLTA